MHFELAKRFLLGMALGLALGIILLSIENPILSFGFAVVVLILVVLATKEAGKL